MLKEKVHIGPFLFVYCSFLLSFLVRGIDFSFWDSNSFSGLFLDHCTDAWQGEQEQYFKCILKISTSECWFWVLQCVLVLLVAWSSISPIGMEEINQNNSLMHFGSTFFWLFTLLTFEFNCLHDSAKKRKEYLVLTCGPPSVNTSVPNGKGEDGESCSDDESSGDEENQTVSFYEQNWSSYSLVTILQGSFWAENIQLLECNGASHPAKFLLLPFSNPIFATNYDRWEWCWNIPLIVRL